MMDETSITRGLLEKSRFEEDNDANIDSKDAEGTDKNSVKDINQIIIKYLMARVPVFRDLVEVRGRGSKNHEADAFFAKQRNTADKPTPDSTQYFFKMMHRMAMEMQKYTGALKIPTYDESQNSEEQLRRILDLCMAPGGFLGAAMKLNPGSEAVAFSLPTSKGGHDILLESVEGFNVKETRFLDVTMLAADIMGVSKMSATTIPIPHPDAENFVIERQLDQNETFDLVLCDGQVLRNHERASYREGLRRESTRLLISQLILGLQHLRPGGTMIVLLHKLEAWDTVQLLYEFNKFSNINLFKSKKSHAIRSSFYLIASNVQSRSEDALNAIAKWQNVWTLVTFVLYEDTLRSVFDFQGHLEVERVLQDFGEDLIRLGNGIWSIQAASLRNAPFMKDAKSRYQWGGTLNCMSK